MMQEHSQRPAHVLLLAANQPAVAPAAAALAEAGYRVTAVTHPADIPPAWAQIDLLLLDLNPDNWHLPAVLAAQAPAQRPKVVVLLTAPQTPYLDTPLLAEIDDYVVQPIVTSQLLARIKFLLRFRQAELHLQQREAFLAILNQVTRTTLQMQTYAEMLQQLADWLGDLFHADSCYISRWDDEYQRVYPAVAHGPMRETYASLIVTPDEPTITEAVLQAGHPLAIEDVYNSDYVTPQRASQFPTRSLLALPLIAQGRRLGAALIAYHAPRPFTAKDLQQAEQVAAPLALALAQAELLDNERHQRQLAETLYKVTAALNSRLAADELLNLILEQLGQVVPYHSASIMLLDGHTLNSVARRSVYQATRGSTIDIRHFQHVQDVLESNQPLIIPDTLHDPRWQKLSPTPSLRCWMGVPLTTSDETLGILNLSANQPYFFRLSQARVVTTFADHAAIALQNVRLYEALQGHAASLEEGVRARTRELVDAYERLQELDQLKSKLIDDISHELRTPVTNLALYLDLWERGKSERRAQYWAILKQEVQRLVQLVEGIVTVSQLDLMRGNVTLNAVDLNAVVKDLTAVYTARGEAKGVLIYQRLSPGLPAVRGNAQQISEALAHLLDNALAHTETGGIAVRTFWDAARQMLCLQVHDTGDGIAETDRPHVFDRFYRGQGASQSNKPGMGLGLTIAQEIVQLHRGQIEIQSALGQGTTVTIWFPASAPSE